MKKQKHEKKQNYLNQYKSNEIIRGVLRTFLPKP